MASLGDSLNTEAFDRIREQLDKALTRETNIEDSSTTTSIPISRGPFASAEDARHLKSLARFFPATSNPRNDSASSRRVAHDRFSYLRPSQSFSGTSSIAETPQLQGSMALPQAASFSGFTYGFGGDTQAGNSQLYKDYTTSMLVSPSQGRVEHGRDSAEELGNASVQHTLVEGDTGFINVVPSEGQGIQEIEESDDLSQSLSVDDHGPQGPDIHEELPAQDPPFLPVTPALAGAKRNHRGEIVSSASTKTPGTTLTAVFGKSKHALPGMTMSQMFEATQARSSPIADLPRSDGIFQRPSPNFEALRHSSPIPMTSSPIKHMRSDFSRANTEPRDYYTSMQESQERREMRQLRKEQEERHFRSTFDGHVSEDSEDEFGLPSVRKKYPANVEPRKPDALMRRSPGRVFTKGKHLSSDSAYATPDKQPVVEISDDDDDDSDLDPNENDEYDELGQEVLRSQAYEDEEIPDESAIVCDRPDPIVSHVDHRQQTSTAADVELEVAGSPQNASPGPDTIDRAISGSAQSGFIADSQPTHQDSIPDSDSERNGTKASHAPNQLDSYIPSWTTSENQKLTAMVVRQHESNTGEIGQQGDGEGMPSSPPLNGDMRELRDPSRGKQSNADGDLAKDAQSAFEVDRNEQAQSSIGNAELSKPPLVENSNSHAGAYLRKSSQVSIIPETSPPSTPSRKSVRRPRLSNNQTISATATSSHTPKSDTAHETAISHSPSPAKTPYSSQRPGTVMYSPRLTTAMTMSEMAANRTKPADFFEAEGGAGFPIDELLPTAEDEAHKTALGDASPKRISKRRKLEQQLAINTSEVFPDEPMMDPASPSLQIGQNQRTPPSAKKREGAGASAAAKAGNAILQQVHDNDSEKSPPSTCPSPGAKPSRASSRMEKSSPKVTEQLQGDLEPPLPTSDRTNKQVQSDHQMTRKLQHSDVKKPIETPRKRMNDDETDHQELLHNSIDTSSPLTQISSTPSFSEQMAQLSGDTKIAPTRVFAVFKNQKMCYYPATYLGPSTQKLGCFQILFDDGSIDPKLELKFLRILDLREGDQVRVDRTGMRKDIYVIQELEKKVQSSAEEDPTRCDIHGFRTAIIAKKRDSLANNTTAAGNTISVDVSDLYLDRHLGEIFLDRKFVPGLSQITQLPVSTPITATASSSTTPSRLRPSRPAAPISTTTAPKPTTPATKGPNKAGIFNNMAFALTFPRDKDTSTRQYLSDRIRNNGGYIINDTFQSLFMPGPGPLFLSFENRDLGFTAVITDRHSRRTKHIEALALRIPILHIRWIEDCLDAAAAAADADADAPDGSLLNYEPYLLPSGESSILGAVRSLVLPRFYDPASTSLLQMLKAGGALMQGKKVAVRPKEEKDAEKDTLGTYEFLMRAMGARRLVVWDDDEDEDWDGDWDLLFVEDERQKNRGAKGVFDSEDLVQSLILGKMVVG